MAAAKSQMNRVVAALTLGMLAWAFLEPTHVLGDTAVYGRAYLWGESSLRVNVGREIVWFVDRWEVAQQATFAMAAIACVVVLIQSSSRALLVVAVALLGLIGLALQRSLTGDGVMLPSFVAVVAWTVAVMVMTVLGHRQARLPRTSIS